MTCTIITYIMYYWRQKLSQLKVNIYAYIHICMCFMNDCSNLSANHSTIFKKKWLHLYCNVVCECKFEHLGWESIHLLQEGWAREEVRERLQGSEHGRLGVAQNDCEQFSLIRAGTEVGSLPGKARKESNHQQKRNISFKPLQEFQLGKNQCVQRPRLPALYKFADSKGLTLCSKLNINGSEPFVA